MTRPYTPPQIADGLLAGEFTRDSAFVPLAEVERLRAEIVSLEATGAEASDEIDRLRKEMLDLAEWCEAEGPLAIRAGDGWDDLTKSARATRIEIWRCLIESHKRLAYRLREALEGKL